MPEILQPSFVIETSFSGESILKEIERFARTCYKSEDKITNFESTKKFVGRLLHTNKHEGIVDHHVISVRIVCDRGVSHEIVRHRIAAYLQESTRFCDYAKAGEIQVIAVLGMTPEQFIVWECAMEKAEQAYNELRELGCSPQIARSVLPNSLKTELVMSLDLRSWRNFFKLRTASNAHPQMREIAVPLLAEFKRRIPVIFDDL
jgi:thymidylate synthase (FAD)